MRPIRVTSQVSSRKSGIHKNTLSPMGRIEKELESEREKVKHLSEELLRHKRDFQTLAEHAPDIICRFGKQFHHLYVNPAIEKATTVPTHLFIGKTPHEAGLPREFADYWVKHIESVFKTGKEVSIEFSFPTPVGQKYFQSLLVPEISEDNTVETVLSISRDITNIREHEKQKEEFFGIVSHELKTPVTTLKAFTQVLHHKFLKANDIENAEYLAKMDIHLNKLTKLIGDLLDVTKIEGGQFKFEERRFDFNELVQEIVNDMQRTTDKHQIIIDGKVSSKLPGDRDRIGQVITNFISNAIKYAPPSSQIIVKVSSDKKTISCCVQDFGMGIPPDKKQQIFDRFFRITGDKRETFPGLGLGLYISSQIIRRQNGKIWVESEVGKGASFCFTLPLKKPLIKNSR